MNAESRARVIAALKIIAILSLICTPLATYLDAEEISLSIILPAIIDGVIECIGCLALAILVEAAHWYISSKEEME